MLFKDFTKEWFSNVRKDLLAGTVVALALIPEAIAFSIIAGVDRRSASASFCIAVVTACRRRRNDRGDQRHGAPHGTRW
jgi:SulP family sulfate permease